MSLKTGSKSLKVRGYFMALIAKICLLGDGKVGKTSLANRYLGKGFNSDYIPTLGSDFTSKNVILETEQGTKEIRFQIWDLAGQLSFGQIRSLYYRGSAGAVLVFDLTNPDTLKNLKTWTFQFLEHCKIPSTTLVVLGNKADLKSEIKVSRRVAEGFIQKELANIQNNTGYPVEYFETSAKSGQNVDQAFWHLGKTITDKVDQ
jgi:small GTP-binding protein